MACGTAVKAKPAAKCYFLHFQFEHLYFRHKSRGAEMSSGRGAERSRAETLHKLSQQQADQAPSIYNIGTVITTKFLESAISLILFDGQEIPKNF
jgi:hypothetical protein